ncbi:Gfo/Idh/MocA family oxidoreductase [Lachnospiraceae bacterium 54-53]
MEKVKFGIIGFGVQGSSYSGFLAGRPKPDGPQAACPEHGVLGAICDIDEEKEKEAKRLFPEYPFFKSWKDMVDSKTVDAVITTVPHYLHPEIAIYCLEHGMNVLVEKPAGVYTKQVLEMNACAKKHTDVAFGIMFNQRTNQLYQKVKEIVESGELGEIRRSSWMINSWWRPDSYYRQSEWRATWGGEGGGVLVNQAPHQLDLWQWICGVPIKVYAKCVFGAHRQISVENDVTVLTEYENGSTGSFITCTHDPIGTDRLEIDLSGGKMVVDKSREITVYKLKKNEKVLNETVLMKELSKLVADNSGEGNGLYEVTSIVNNDGWGYQHVEVMENFARHVLYKEPLLAPGSHGIHGVRLANACLLSSWLNKEIEMPFDDDEYLLELNKRIREEGKFPEREI